MKPLICISVGIIIIVASFRVLGQAGDTTSALNQQLRMPHTQAGHPASGIHMMRLPSPEQRAIRKSLFADTERLAKQARIDYASGNISEAEQNCLSSIVTAPVIGGKKAQVPIMEQLLGRIYLREGRNQEALTAFQSCYHNIADAGQNLDISIAYARLGDYAQAKKFYSDRAITQYRISEEPLKPEDLPGTSDLKSLEASALFARGLDEFFQHQQDEALDDFKAAERRAPNNIPIAYWCAQTLMEKGRIAEAAPRLERVVASNRGHIFHEAKQSLYAAQAASKAVASTAR